MKKLNVILLAVLVLSLLCGSAFAQTVRFGGEVPTIPVTDADGEALEDLSAETIVLLGVDDDDVVEIYANESLVFATKTALKEAIPELDSYDLPALSEIQDIGKGTDRERVVEIQQALIDLGYLNGVADGSFGGQSRRAVSDFQKAMKLKATGTADAVTQQLIFSLLRDEQAVEVAADPTDLYAAIIDHCETDLTPLYEHAMTFEFDDITGKGFITNGAAVSGDNEEGPDIDRYDMSVLFGFAVTDSKGVAKLTPVIKITSTSVRSPLLQDILLKSGDDRQTVKVKTTESSIDGSKSVEACTLNLSAASAALLANVKEAGELKLRVEGKYQSYDVAVDEEQLDGIAEIGAIAAEMLGE